MKSAALVERYSDERNNLLRTITELLEGDPGVKAAWLFGSMGRGEADSLSDLDLWVVVDDDRIEAIIAQPLAYASQVGAPILNLEAPQNAPEGGVYLMACYDAPIAPHIVDWYWQPQSRAHIPDRVRILFDRVGLAHNDQPIQFAGRPVVQENLEPPMHFISFFWMMLMITAKHAARSPWSEKLNLLPFLLESIKKTRRLSGPGTVFTPINIPTHKSPGEKIQLLYQLADQMTEMMQVLSKRGEEVPISITPGAYRYLNLIQTLLHDKEQANNASLD